MDKFIIFIIILYIAVTIVSILLAFNHAERTSGKDNINKMNQIIKYRNEHPKCRYCKYLETIKENIPDIDCYGFWYGNYIKIKRYRCKIKDKDIKLKNSFKGCFCDYFKLGEIRNDD